MTFIFNGAILYIVRYLHRRKPSILRLLIGSFVATSFVPLVVYYPESMFNHIFAKVLYSIVIILTAYRLYSFNELIKHVFTFYIVTFIVGGSLLSVHYVVSTSFELPFQQ